MVQCRADNARNLHFSCVQYENHEQARLAQSLPKSESDNSRSNHISRRIMKTQLLPLISQSNLQGLGIRCWHQNGIPLHWIVWLVWFTNSLCQGGYCWIATGKKIRGRVLFLCSNGQCTRLVQLLQNGQPHCFVNLSGVQDVFHQPSDKNTNETE